MGKKRKKKRKDEFEDFYFTVDDWCREYRFEINRHKWEFSPGHHAERDTIKIAGRLRTRTRWRILSGEVHLLPSHVPRDRLSDEADRIGNTWVHETRLYCSAFIPADAYYSLSPVLAENKFAEMKIRVRDLKYGKGHTDEVALEFELSGLEEEEVISLAEQPVEVRAMY